MYRAALVLLVLGSILVAGCGEADEPSGQANIDKREAAVWLRRQKESAQVEEFVANLVASGAVAHVLPRPGGGALQPRALAGSIDLKRGAKAKRGFEEFFAATFEGAGSGQYVSATSDDAKGPCPSSSSTPPRARGPRA